MSTLAERIESGERKPTAQVKDAMDNVEAAAKGLLDGIREALRSGELVQRVHLDDVIRRLDEEEPDEKLLLAADEGKIAQGTAARFSKLTSAKALERAEIVAADWEESGTYAYRFEQMDDGSILAVYVTKAGTKPKLKAFPNMEATVGWHPTRAPE